MSQEVGLVKGGVDETAVFVKERRNSGEALLTLLLLKNNPYTLYSYLAIPERLEICLPLLDGPVLCCLHALSCLLVLLPIACCRVPLKGYSGMVFVIRGGSTLRAEPLLVGSLGRVRGVRHPTGLQHEETLAESCALFLCYLLAIPSGSSLADLLVVVPS